jgi:hypothetical protein
LCSFASVAWCGSTKGDIRYLPLSIGFDAVSPPARVLCYDRPKQLQRSAYLIAHDCVAWRVGSIRSARQPMGIGKVEPFNSLSFNSISIYPPSLGLSRRSTLGRLEGQVLEMGKLLFASIGSRCWRHADGTSQDSRCVSKSERSASTWAGKDAGTQAIRALGKMKILLIMGGYGRSLRSPCCSVAKSDDRKPPEARQFVTLKQLTRAS